MEEIIKKDLCTGCSACMNICPKNAIKMEENKEGFKYPVIDQEKCVNCGACKNVCPVINTKENYSINECYGGYNKNKESLLSRASSGSVFELIAKFVLNEKGIVIGAAFDSFNKLNHIAIDNITDLEKLKGSKYLQSNIGNIFSYIKNNIKTKKILFVGTPCQVGGLKSFLKKDYDNLICLDIVCHGVPSPKLFEKYIKELEEKNNDKVIDYNFRDKSISWQRFSTYIKFENKENNLCEPFVQNPYMNLFLSNVSLRQSCYNCNFKLQNRYSDITLGDFWGVQKKYPELYNKEGVSCILINTENGKKVFEIIKDELFYITCNLDSIIDGNPALVESPKIPSKRTDFFNEIDSLNVEELANKYKNKTNFFKKVYRYINRKLLKKKI